MKFFIRYAYFLKRNAKKLFTFLSISISISLIYTLKLKNVWQGEFQIVLDDEESQINGWLNSLGIEIILI